MKNKEKTEEIFSSEFLKEAQWRGFIYQGTNNSLLDEKIQESKKPLVLYIGFDATASSLHVGNLMGIMFARLAQKNGLKPILLLGGGTTKIGDPSGKTEARQLLDDSFIQKNIRQIEQCFSRFLSIGEEKTDAIVLNNDAWLKNINYIDFLRDYGRHFSINRMLTMDSVKLRLDREQSLSFLEFNYMILQAYDFLFLKENYDCALQIGGSDQWGNIVNGVDLTRRVLGKEVFGLTAPLIMTASGEKMGKTHKGAVWLNEENLSPYDYWQFWRNCHDEDVIPFMKIYTDLPHEEIENFSKSQGAALNNAKIHLANEATTMLHGKEAAISAQKTASNFFVANTNVEDIEIKNFLDTGMPVINTNLPLGIVSKGMLLVEALCALGMTKSKGEGRRMIKGKGIRLNGSVVEDENKIFLQEDFFSNRLGKVAVGKKRQCLFYLKEENIKKDED